MNKTNEPHYLPRLQITSFSWKMSEQCPEVTTDDLVHTCQVHPLRAPFASTQCDILKSDIFKVIYSSTCYIYLYIIGSGNNDVIIGLFMSR